MLIDKKRLDEILKDLYILSGVRIAVFDEWQREISAFPHSICDYCKERRHSKDFDELCKASDKKAFEIAESTHLQYTYKCHAGLYESVCPIISGGAVIGFLMIGQFVSKESEDENIKAYNLGLNVLSTESIKAIASTMSICAEYLCFSDTVSARHTGLAEKAKKFVWENLSTAISVQYISSALGISRTSTYTLFKKSFGKSVTEYVNYQRIELAKQMIRERYKISSILEKINISDSNYFYRMFKKHTGMSVSEFKSLEMLRYESKS